jgi:predicted O-methyltransferase YrrM
MTQAWYMPSDPKDIEPLPWLSPEVVDYLEEIVKPEFRVLEHGGGGSTLWFAQHCAEVVTSETEKEWRDAIRSKAAELKLTNIILLDGWPAIPNNFGKFDIIVIDGAPLHQKGRALLDAFDYYSKPGGFVVLDNFNRPEYDREFVAVKARADVRLFFTKHGRYLNTAIWKL